MTLVGSSCKAGAADLTIDGTTLLVGGCYSLRFVVGVPFFGVTFSYCSRNAHHDFCLGGICEKTNQFKQSNKDVKGFLEPDRITRGNHMMVIEGMIV